VIAVLQRTATELRGAAVDARTAWNGDATLGAVLLAFALLAPVVVTDDLRLAHLTEWLAFAIAALGLGIAVGVGAMPSLAQGAFVAVGAFAAALLQERAGWSPAVAVPVAVLIAAGSGVVTGAGLVRLRPVFVAAGTWLLAWLAAAALEGFPDLSGGSDGLDVGPPSLGGLELRPWLLYEVVLALLVLVVLAFGAYARGLPGLALAALGQRPVGAAALGLPPVRLRLAAFVAASAAGGLAGAVEVQAAGLADPSAYGPLLSFELLGAVVLGGGARALGPLVGTGLIALAGVVAGGLTAVGTLRPERFTPVAAAILVFAGLSLGRPLVGRRRPRAQSAAAPPARASVAPATLAATGLSKRYGEIVALDDFALELAPGELCALVGPNGSGKTTALRILAGSLAPDTGTIRFGQRDLTAAPVADRVRAGIVRTLQATAVFPELTVLENVLAGGYVRRAHGGVARTVLATPKARSEAARARAGARGILAEVGLARDESRLASELGSLERRLLMLATAVATRPAVLLVDELAAGAAAADLDRIVAALARLRAAGTSLLLVEHDFALLRRLAERVVVLDAGRTIAVGTPEQVAADPAVRAAYLGPRA